MIGTLVAVPGDEIEVRDGLVHVNGELAAPTAGGNEGHGQTVPLGSYYLIGHEQVECDSRVWGFLPESHVVEQAE